MSHSLSFHKMSQSLLISPNRSKSATSKYPRDSLSFHHSLSIYRTKSFTSPKKIIHYLFHQQGIRRSLHQRVIYHLFINESPTVYFTMKPFQGSFCVIFLHGIMHCPLYHIESFASTSPQRIIHVCLSSVSH